MYLEFELENYIKQITHSINTDNHILNKIIGGTKLKDKLLLLLYQEKEELKRNIELIEQYQIEIDKFFLKNYNKEITDSECWNMICDYYCSILKNNKIRNPKLLRAVNKANTVDTTETLFYIVKLYAVLKDIEFMVCIFDNSPESEECILKIVQALRVMNTDKSITQKHYFFEQAYNKIMYKIDSIRYIPPLKHRTNIIEKINEYEKKINYILENNKIQTTSFLELLTLKYNDALNYYNNNKNTFSYYKLLHYKSIIYLYYLLWTDYAKKNKYKIDMSIFEVLDDLIKEFGTF